MIVCDEGTQCSARVGASVLAYGFIDRQSEWRRSDFPCLDQRTLGKLFGTLDETIPYFGGQPVLKHLSYSYAPWRGPSSCDLCEKIVDENGRIVVGRKFWIGIALIPSRKIAYQYYLFPVGLGHLIELHNYLPPDDLIDAIANFEFDAKWNTAALEHKLFYPPSARPFHSPTSSIEAM